MKTNRLTGSQAHRLTGSPNSFKVESSSSGCLSFSGLRLLMAGILTIAALLKTTTIQGSNSFSFELLRFTDLSIGIHYLNWLSIASVVAELATAGLLLSALGDRQAWWAGLSFFSVLATAAALRFLSGASDCNCFGPIAVHPLAALGIDVIVLSLLLLMNCKKVTRPIATRCIVNSRLLLRLHDVIRFVLNGVTVGTGVLLLTQLLTQSMEQLVSGNYATEVTRDAVSLTKSVQVSGRISVAKPQLVEFDIPIRNQSPTPFSILGMKADCSCHQTDLPLVVAPFSKENLRISTAVESFRSGQTMEKNVILVHDQGGPGVKVRLVTSFN